jgi:beta-mannosidase
MTLLSSQPTRASLAGDDWQLWRAPLRPPGDRTMPDLTAARGYGQVAVPGNVQVQAGLQDLWTDVPELTSLNHDEWIYMRRFDGPALAADERCFLEFDGVDYFCDVWVDGHWAGHHEGQFGTFELDITEALDSGSSPDHELVIAVSCPWRVDERQFYLQPSTVFSVVLKNSEYMKGNLLHYWDGLPFSGNAVFPFGLWEDVRLVTRQGVALRRVSVATTSIGAGDGTRPADMEMTCEWWVDERHGPRTLELQLDVGARTFSGPSASYRFTTELEGSGQVETTHTFQVEQPHLWWTWDTGRPDLYQATLRTADGRHKATSTFGIREIRRDEETLAYYLNGQRLFLRGVWYPFANIFTALPQAAELRRDVEMLRDGNNNHIVVFTFIEKEPLYEACDELGMLVLQELPYQQLGPMKVVEPGYPRYQEYRDWSLGEVADMVRQRRGHPSVVMWGPFAETRKHGKWVWADYTEYVAAIEEIVTAGDRDALFHKSYCDFEEEHIWNGGFPFGEFWDHYERDHQFISEFGGISPPNVETLREFMPPDAIWGRPDRAAGRVNLPIDVEEYSYRWAFDYAGLCTSVARMYRWADRHPPTLERFVDAIQWYQALGLRYCAEVYRRKRFASIAGCRTWSYRENVPGIKFTVVDHRQRPKMGYFGLAAGYEPVLLSIDDQFPLRSRPAGSRYAHDLWVVNDTPERRQLTVDAVLHGVDGSVLDRQRLAVDVNGDAGIVAGSLDLTLPSSSGPVLLRSVAYDREGAFVTSSDTWINVAAAPFDSPVRVLLLGQGRYNAPVREALADIGGVAITVVDETNRNPQDSGWATDLANRYDVVWFTGWDAAVHHFRPGEFAAIRDAIAAGVGFIHTSGQGSFHGGDGRGAQLDVTPLGDALPVTMRPHEGVWDLIPETEPAADSSPLFDLELQSMPFKGYSRTAARTGSQVHWRIGSHPLLVTGTHGAGRTAAFMGYLTKPLRMFRIGEGLDWEDPLDVEPHWARRDIRAYGPYWPGILELSLALIAWVTGREDADIAATAEAHRKPLYERLAELPETAVEGHVAAWQGGRGEVTVRNVGGVVARLVRGVVEAGDSTDHRFRDGFVDLLPGESRTLRFEADDDHAVGLSLSGQNVPAVTVPILAG